MSPLSITFYSSFLSSATTNNIPHRGILGDCFKQPMACPLVIWWYQYYEEIHVQAKLQQFSLQRTSTIPFSKILQYVNITAFYHYTKQNKYCSRPSVAAVIQNDVSGARAQSWRREKEAKAPCQRSTCGEPQGGMHVLLLEIYLISEKLSISHVKVNMHLCYVFGVIL